MSQTNREEFKNQLDKGNWFQAFLSIIEDVLTLKIKSVVEDEVQELGDSLSGSSFPSASDREYGKRLLTVIDLIDGDIENRIGKRFFDTQTETSNYKDLRDFHEKQVAKGEIIIQENLKTLKTAIDHLIEFYQKEQETKKSKPNI